MKKTVLALAFASSLPMLASQAAQACGSDPYLGTICYTTYNWGCPQGTLPADGRLLSIQQYTALYSLVGATFGGDARTTFALPDLRARAVVGAGNAPGLTTMQVGTKAGAETVTLNANNLPAHTHPANTTGLGVSGRAAGDVALTMKRSDLVNSLITSDAGGQQGPDATHTKLGKSGGGQGAVYYGDGANSLNQPAGASTIPVSGPASLPITATVSGSVAVGPNVTTGAAVPVRDPYLALNACIVTEGLYPMRP